MRGHGQSVELAFDHFERFTPVPARVVVFRKAETQLVAAGEKKHGIVAA